MRSVLISMSVLTVALGFAACGGQVVSETETEVAVSAELERVIHIDVDTIECPADVSAEPGELFDCQVNAVDRSRCRDDDQGAQRSGRAPDNRRQRGVKVART